MTNSPISEDDSFDSSSRIAGDDFSTSLLLFCAFDKKGMEKINKNKRGERNFENIFIGNPWRIHVIAYSKIDNNSKGRIIAIGICIFQKNVCTLM
jgi:hypothetical protein